MSIGKIKFEFNLTMIREVLQFVLLPISSSTTQFVFLIIVIVKLLKFVPLPKFCFQAVQSELRYLNLIKNQSVLILIFCLVYSPSPLPVFHLVIFEPLLFFSLNISFPL